MIIKQIKLHQFRQYKNTQVIKFSEDSNRNVTVILGINTSGKTTLIEAFKWCLYDGGTYRKSDLINAERAKELGMNQDEEVYVEVVLVHENREYIIRRIRNFKKQSAEKLSLGQGELQVFYKEKNGETVEIDKVDCQSVVNQILPEELADYFFFDGERITSIGNRTDIKSAVQGLMGLDSITAAKNRLDPNKSNSVTSIFEKGLDTESSDNDKKLIEDIEKLKKELNKIEEELENKRDSLTYYSAEKLELDKKIVANREVKDLQNRRVELEREIQDLKKQLENSIDVIKTKFSTRSQNFFAVPLIEKALKLLDENHEDLEGIEGMTEKAINYIIERGICVCGRETDTDEIKEHLLKEMKLLPPYHIGTVIRETKYIFKDREKQGRDFIKSFRNNYINYENLKKNIESKEKELIKVSEKIKGTEDVKQLELDRNNCSNEISRLKKEIEDNIKKIGSKESTIDRIRAKRDSLVISSENNKNLRKCINYCTALYNEFNDIHEEKEREVKFKLQKNVNEIFKAMYHGKRSLTIDDNYRVHLGTELYDEVVTTDESKGLETVKNFSFVSGLVKIAKDKVLESTDNNLESMEEPYPLVMDAPFSNVDEIHINNITKILPNVAEQVILILMEKDWNYAKNPIENKIGYVYEIEKIDNRETHSEIREVEKYVQ